MTAEAKTFLTHIAHRWRYWLYTPSDYERNGQKRWPLILFLHGSGERGDDLQLVQKEGLPKWLLGRPDFPFVVVAPQCPADQWWVSYNDALIALLNKVIATEAIDETRVYLTGLSLGGFGAWHLATDYPDRFAALIPICGFGHRLWGYPERLQRIVHMPVWTFHGGADPIVRPAETRALVKALRAYGGDVRYTVYKGVGHNAWEQTYANEDIYQWLLEHRLSR